MGFNINDRVKHIIYGNGTVVEIDGIDNYLVQFDVPNTQLHNGNGQSVRRYPEHTCYYCCGGNLELLNDEKLVSSINVTKSEVSVLLPERYIINENACILFWENGEKTVVKRCADDEFNPRLAFLTAFWQHYCGMSKNKANKYLASLQVEVKPEPKQKPKQIEEETKFEVGDKVEVIEENMCCKKGWKGKIIKIDNDNTVLVRFYNNDEEHWILRERIKLIKEEK